MWTISITANRRAKRTKIWDSGFYGAHIWKVPLMPNSLSLVWDHSVHFAKFPILQFLKTLHLSQFSSDPSKLYTRYHNYTGRYDGQKLQKKYGIVVNLNGCQNTAMGSWHLVPKIILFKTFQNILVYWVFSSSRASRPLGLLFRVCILKPWKVMIYQNFVPHATQVQNLWFPCDAVQQESHRWFCLIVILALTMVLSEV